MTNNSTSYIDTQICNNLDVRVKHEHNNIIEQSGRSMIEMLGVLAIIGVLSVGGIAGYSKAMMKFKINKIIDQVTHIATNTRTLYAQQTSYSGLYVTNAVQMGIIPTELGTEISTDQYASKLKNPFNGSVYIAGDGYGSNGFVITYQGIPKEACIALATYDWGNNYSSGLIAVSISNEWNISGPIQAMTEYYGCEGGADYVACPGDAVNPTPISVATAAQKCDCEDNSCSIGWKFK